MNRPALKAVECSSWGDSTWTIEVHEIRAGAKEYTPDTLIDTHIINEDLSYVDGVAKIDSLMQSEYGRRASQFIEGTYI